MTGLLQHDWVDASAAPLYVWRIPASPSTEDLDEALAAIRAWVRTLDGPYGWINDPRALQLRTVATQRRMLADHLRFVEPYSKRFCAGMATLAENTIVRGIGTAIGWLYTYPFPTRYCATEEEARRWVWEQLGTRGVTPPLRGARA